MRSAHLAKLCIPKDKRRLWLVRRLFFSLLLLTAPAFAAPAGSAALVASQPRLLHVSEGTSFPLEFTTFSGKQAEILLETSAPGIEFVLQAPGGKQIQTITARYPGWVVVSFPLAGPGIYEAVARTVQVQKPAPQEFAGVDVRVLSLSISATGRNRAEELFASAQTLLRSPKGADLHLAIGEYAQAESLWAKAGDRHGEILALAGQARALLGLSEHDKAIATLARAMSLCAPGSFWYAWLENLQAQVYLDRWDNEAARRKSEDALRVSHTLDDEWLTADALADRGESEYLTHDPAARADIEGSLRLARRGDAVTTLARALRCASWIEKDQGHLTPAFARLDQARSYFHQDGDIRSEMQALSTLATIGTLTGDPYSALLRHTKIAALMRESGYASHYAILLHNIASDYEALNRLPDAILFYRQALVIYRNTHHISGEALTLSDLCSMEMGEKRLNEALRDCRASNDIVEKIHDSKRIATSLWRLGTVYRAFGQTDRAVATFRRAEELSETVHDARSAAENLLDWGDTITGLGDRTQAHMLYDKALQMSLAAENLHLQIEARYRIAQTDFQSGYDEEAKRSLDVALENIATQRRSVGNADLQASYFAQVRKCHDLYVDILMSEQQRDPASGAAARALEITESGRALTLLDTIALRGADTAAAGKGALSQEMQQFHLAVEQAYDQRLKLMIEGSHKADLDANAAKLTEAIDALERAEDEQKQTSRPVHATSRTLTAKEIAAASVASQSTLVEYMLGATHSYVWVVDHGKIESYVLPPRDQIASLVRQWRSLATARIGGLERGLGGASFVDVDNADKELPGIAANLSRTLLGSFLRPGMDHLVVVPDGELHLLPFAALPEADGKDPIALARHVVLTPSLSVLLTATKVNTPASYRGVVALLADPVFDRDDSRVQKVGVADRSLATRNRPQFAPALPRLAGTDKEARAIASLTQPGSAALYLGFDANLQTLLNPSLGDYRILHLATHGVLDEAVPDFSGIVLSLVGRDGQPIFGYLKAHDIEALHLRSDLVVLSSCDSSAGANLSGEGVRGLNHAFLSAGARRVVSTLWSVDDDITQELMKSFYTGMLADGLDPAEALRRSQVKMMRSPHTASPYFWAAYSITSTVD